MKYLGHGIVHWVDLSLCFLMSGLGEVKTASSVGPQKHYSVYTPIAYTVPCITPTVISLRTILCLTKRSGELGNFRVAWLPGCDELPTDVHPRHSFGICLSAAVPLAT